MAGREPSARLRGQTRPEKPPVVRMAGPDGRGASPPEPHAARRRRFRQDDDGGDGSPVLDAFRFLTFLLVVSCGLSYLVSGGESWFWGIKDKPDYAKLSWWKLKYNGPRSITLDELAGYDGTDPAKPVYLSINGSVFDVSAGRHIYGPGGSYHWFAGIDASRAFVTGCFADDRTGDLRGVEAMFLPLDNPEIDRHWTAEELARIKADEQATARARVQEAVQHWVDFFHRSPKYHYVGQLLRTPGWEGEPKPLCQSAQNSRAYRNIPGTAEP